MQGNQIVIPVKTIPKERSNFTQIKFHFLSKCDCHPFSKTIVEINLMLVQKYMKDITFTNGCYV